MRWEYKHVELDIRDLAPPAFDRRLNLLGAQGWELVASLQRSRHGYSHEVHLVFKRVVAEREIEPALAGAE